MKLNPKLRGPGWFLALALMGVAAGASVEAQTTPKAQEQSESIDGFRDTPMLPGKPWHLHDPDRPQPRVVTPPTTFSQGAPAPSDAEVLFDGRDLSKWQNGRGEAPHWKVQDGYLETGRGGGIRTRGAWADFQLHVEWAAPLPAQGSGQGRGNSGILINGMYEVQVLDSFRAKTYPDGQAGAIYGQVPPLVNASKPPGEWQTYDILFESPRWNEAGELIKKACVTVIHNGVVIHHRYEFAGGTDGISREVPWKTLAKYTPHPPEVFIGLQDHNNPVRYRNVWIRPLGEYDKP
ncbi:MAG: DUF1080 domain-containing protein [Verrucomicrobiales bacterium]|nr:DUF1080 domain-containing protein [Verrucomicrobiales bacterium]